VFLQQLAKRNEDLPGVGPDVVISRLVLALTFRDQAEQPPQSRCLILCPRWGWHLQANEAVRVQPDLHAFVHPHASCGEELHSEQTEGACSGEAVNWDEHCACFDGGIFVEPLVPTSKTPGQESSDAFVQWAVVDPSIFVRVAPFPKPCLRVSPLFDGPESRAAWYRAIPLSMERPPPLEESDQ
jgi:hypothetical protein